MTYDFEAEARRRLNEAAGDSGLIRTLYSYATRKTHHPVDAMCRLLEEYQAFRREVSDAVENVIHVNGMADWHRLRSFIIPEPVDPLVEAVKDCQFATLDAIEVEFSKALSEALAKRGWRIVFDEEKAGE